MKKSLLILSALMALSMAFVGCKGGSDPVQEPAVEEEPKESVVFEGEKVLTIDGFDNYIEFDKPLSGYSEFEVTLSWDSKDGVQCQAQLMNDGSQASETISFGSKSEATISGKCMVGAKYNKWVDGVSTLTDCDTSANKLQVFIQTGAPTWEATTGKVTVKKIVLK